MIYGSYRLIIIYNIVDKTDSFKENTALYEYNSRLSLKEHYITYIISDPSNLCLKLLTHSFCTRSSGGYYGER